MCVISVRDMTTLPLVGSSTSSRLYVISREKDETATPSSNKSSSTDVLSASRIVLGVVTFKYEKRLASLGIAVSMEPPRPMAPGSDERLHRCPMFDGSLDPFLQQWDGSFLDPESVLGPPLTTSALGTGSRLLDRARAVMFHDLWATMTMGWSRERSGDVDFSDI